MTFGRRIKELRLKKGLTQRKLAEQIGIDYGYLSKIESEKLPPPSDTVIVKLAEALNADKDELFILAKKVPTDLTEMIAHHPPIVAVLRRAKGLTEEDWRRVNEYIKRLERKRKSSS